MASLLIMMIMCAGVVPGEASRRCVYFFELDIASSKLADGKE